MSNENRGVGLVHRPSVTPDGHVRILYLVYWGAAEPLGQSIVLPPVTRIAAMRVGVTLVTFEKRADLMGSEMPRIRVTLERNGVRWLALPYHKRPRWPATLFDVLHGLGVGLLESVRGRPQIVHARTFIGGVIGMLLAPLVGAKFVYHAEGFYPDEQVDGGVWTRSSLPYRLAKFVERLLYSRAHGIVVLSERAKAQVERLPAVRQRATAVIVVPSCVDLRLFPAIDRPHWTPERTLRLVYIGSIGNRYLFQRAAEFVAVAYRRLGRIRFRILTPTVPDIVHEFLLRSGLPSEVTSVAYVPHADMAQELAQQDAGLFLLTRGLSEHGCSPTKVGEYWASGLPVVITPNISDIEDIIRHERVGVLLAGFSADAYRRALDELLALLQDPDLPMRCRAAAERHYGLESACGRLHTMYEVLVGPNVRSRRTIRQAYSARPATDKRPGD